MLFRSRQEIIPDITLFTSEPKARFYSDLFAHLDLSGFPDNISAAGRKGFSNHAKLRTAIVMKCECLSCITDLLDYLQNNLLIAHYCGFNIMKPLPSYWTLDRFINGIDNELLQSLMHSQVKKLYEAGIIDASFIALDSTPIMANTSHNNPKSFKKDKFKSDSQPKSDKDCGLGVHTASNQHNEKKFEFYWGYKNHVLVDCITGLPIFELTTTADVHDSSVAFNILSQTDSFLPISDCTFIADKAYDVKEIYNTVKTVYNGDCAIPLNKRNTKNPEKFPSGHPLCKAGFAMNKDGKTYDNGRTRQNTAVRSSNPKSLFVPAIIRIGTTVRKTRAVPNMLRFPMITDFLLTATVFPLKRFIHSGLKLNAIIHALSRPVRKGFGFTV